MTTKKILVNGVEVGEYISTGDDMKDLRIASAIVEKMGYTPRRTPGRAIFNNAVQFANAASYIYDRDLKRSPYNMAAAVAFIVNVAFAIELYLKALLAQHGVKRGKVHSLLELFDALPDAARDAVSRAIPAAAAAAGVGADRDFRADIAALNNVFVDWRYCYEREELGPVHLRPMLVVAVALHEAFREMDTQNAAAVESEALAGRAVRE